MEHSFDVEIAVKYGIAVAILLKHFHFWCEKNKENDRHLHDGLYWTYHSVSSLMETFPYLTKYQIRQALKDMVKEDLIIEGNFPNRTNRSKWYALTEIGKSICRNQTMHLPKSTNPFAENEQCIVRNQQMDCSKSTNAYTDINTDINTDSITTDRDADRKRAIKRKPTKQSPVRHKYGEYQNVLLSDDELEKLKEIDWNINVMIERLSEYMASTGKSYKSHYATLRSWIRRDRERNQKQTVSAVNGSNELDAFYQMTADWVNEGNRNEQT